MDVGKVLDELLHLENYQTRFTTNKLAFISILPMHTHESHSCLGPHYRAQLPQGLAGGGRTDGLISMQVNGSPPN